MTARLVAAFVFGGVMSATVALVSGRGLRDWWLWAAVVVIAVAHAICARWVA